MKDTPLLDQLHAALIDVVSRDATNDMSVRQFCVLTGLRKGARTVRDLASETKIGKPSISRSADSLAVMGLAQRKDDPLDRRSVLVLLTPAGKRFLQAISEVLAGSV